RSAPRSRPAASRSKQAPRGAGRTRRPPTAPVTPPRKKGKGPRRRSILWRWRRGLFMVGLMGVAASGGAAAVVLNIDLPSTDPLLQTSFVCSAEVTEACGPDNAIATFRAEEDRINVPLEELPPVLTQAVLATEDRDFYNHSGIDPVGITRALYRDLRGDVVRQGGSTITQQYVKNVYLTSERSVVRKVKEAVLAVKLERELEKDEILERYLNTIYFGRGAYGVGAASRAYFGKDVRQIGLPEVTYLAGLIRAPESADATRSVEEAERRRSTVLTAMVEEGHISGDEQAAAEAITLTSIVSERRERTGLGDVRGDDIGTKYFVEAVRRQIAERYGEETLYGGGLRIYTTIDFDMQRAAWNAVTSTLDRPEDPSAALVAVDQYGYVKAMVGGRDFENQEVNLALGAAAGGSGRGAGSAFKPLVLAEAVRQDISLDSKFSAPGTMTFPGVQGAREGEDWKVGNYGGTEQGVLDLVDATRVSSNTAYAQLMLEVGPENVVRLADQLGVSAELPPVPALVLGSGDVSPLDMAVAYSTFANRGLHNDPIMISRIEQVDEDGRVRVIEQATPSSDRVLTEVQADLVTHCLRQVVLGGTGQSADIGRPAAGKTGTTQDNKDAWFVGYTPKLTAAVWMGFADPLPDGTVPVMDDVRGREVTGGSYPAEIWRKFMSEATSGMEVEDFRAPPEPFPGRMLNEELQTTTTRAAPTTTAAETTTTTEAETTTTTEAETTTTAPTTTTTSTTSTTVAPVIP
ncbi:MAG: transglycosylase domain-containing protein, partial [Acidimicrobiales bacterium]